MKIEPFKTKEELYQYTLDKIKGEIGENPTKKQIEDLARKMFIATEPLEYFLAQGTSANFKSMIFQPFLAYFHTPLEVNTLGKKIFPSWQALKIDETWEFLKNYKIIDSIVHSEIWRYIRRHEIVHESEILERYGEIIGKAAILDLLDAKRIIRKGNQLADSEVSVRLPSLDLNYRIIKEEIDLFPQNVEGESLQNYNFYRYIFEVDSIKGRKIEKIVDDFNYRLFSQFRNWTQGDADKFFSFATALSVYEKTEHIKAKIPIKEDKLDTIIKVSKNFASDLQQPMSVVDMFLHSLGTCKHLSEVNKTILDFLPQMRQSFFKVNQIIKDLMTLGSELVITPESLNIEDVILAAYQDQLSQLNTSDITFQYQWNHLHKITGDLSKLARACSNIILNAIQAIDGKGNIWFRTKEIEENQKHYLLLSIGNNKSYIPSDEIKKIFDPFYTIKQSDRKGLGLAIVHKIISSHQCKVWCESIEDLGVEFNLTIPLATEKSSCEFALPTHSQMIEAVDQNASEPFEFTMLDEEAEKNTIQLIKKLMLLQEQVHIAIVDDESVYLNLPKTLLGKDNLLAQAIKISQIKDPEVAVEQILGTKMELVLLDIDLNHATINGFDIAKNLRSQGYDGKICIHTNRGLLDSQKKATESGADLVIPKPISKAQLIKLINSLPCLVNHTAKTLMSSRLFVVLDDNDVILDAWKKLEINLLTFESPEEFWQYFHNSTDLHLIDPVIVTDYNFEDSDSQYDGLEFATKLRKDGFRGSIFLSSVYAQNIVDSELVFNGFIDKNPIKAINSLHKLLFFS